MQDQEVKHAIRTLCGREHDRRVAGFVRRVDIHAGLDQLADPVELAVGDRDRERIPAVAAVLVNVRVLVDQQPDHVRIVAPHREHQRRPAVTVPQINLRAVFEQEPRDFDVAFAHRPLQRVVVEFRNFVGIGALFEQVVDTAGIVANHCMDKFLCWIGTAGELLLRRRKLFGRGLWMIASSFQVGLHERWVRPVSWQVAGNHAVGAFQQRNAIAHEYGLDRVLVRLERRVEALLQIRVCAAHAERHRELEWDTAVHRVQVNDLERRMFPDDVIAGDRTPGFGRVERAADDILDLHARVILRVVGGVVERVVNLGVLHHAMSTKRFARGRTLQHANLPLLQDRIVERLDFMIAILAVGEDESRLVIRLRQQRHFVVGGYIHQYIATIRIDRAPGQTPSVIRIPIVLKCGVETLGKDFGDLVLESLALVVGKRHIAGICADPQRQVLGGRLRGDGTAQRDHQRGSQNECGCRGHQKLRCSSGKENVGAIRLNVTRVIRVDLAQLKIRVTKTLEAAGSFSHGAALQDPVGTARKFVIAGKTSGPSGTRCFMQGRCGIQFLATLLPIASPVSTRNVNSAPPIGILSKPFE